MPWTHPLYHHDIMEDEDTPTPHHWARRILEDFVDSFDEQAAHIARQTKASAKRWSTAYSQLSLRDELGYNLEQLSFLTQAIHYAYTHELTLLQILARWHQDWELILSQEDALNSDQISQLKWRARWHRELESLVDPATDQLIMYGALIS